MDQLTSSFGADGHTSSEEEAGTMVVVPDGGITTCGATVRNRPAPWSSFPSMITTGGLTTSSGAEGQHSTITQLSISSKLAVASYSEVTIKYSFISYSIARYGETAS